MWDLSVEWKTSLHLVQSLEIGAGCPALGVGRPDQPHEPPAGTASLQQVHQVHLPQAELSVGQGVVVGQDQVPQHQLYTLRLSDCNNLTSLDGVLPAGSHSGSWQVKVKYDHQNYNKVSSDLAGWPVPGPDPPSVSPDSCLVSLRWTWWSSDLDLLKLGLCLSLLGSESELDVIFSSWKFSNISSLINIVSIHYLDGLRLSCHSTATGILLGLQDSFL